MILNDFSFLASSMANDGYFIKPSSLKSCGAIILRLMPPENCFSVCVLPSCPTPVQPKEVHKSPGLRTVAALGIKIYNLGIPSFTSREGNGTPLQCSRLENPMDGGAW